MRIAFFGGTFDPIHRGHLRLASAAADAFALDRVLFAPVGNQPLKPKAAAASYADRLAMVELALASGVGQGSKTGSHPDPRFAVSTLDAPRPDGSPNYTVDTLAALALDHPSATLFVLTGADSFLDLPRWRSPSRLLAFAEWIVVSRPEFSLPPASTAATTQASTQAFAPTFFDRLELAPLALTAAQRARVHFLPTVHEDVSSTELRRCLHDGDPCADLLPPSVAAYIQAHHLYR